MPDSIREMMSNIGAYTPFLASTLPNGVHKPNWIRIIEALIIGGVIALVNNHVTLKTVQLKIDIAEEAIVKFEQKLDDINTMVISMDKAQSIINNDLQHLREDFSKFSNKARFSQ